MCERECDGLPEGVEDGAVSIDGDGGQCEHGHVHCEDLYERTEGAHEEGKVPALQESRLKL